MSIANIINNNQPTFDLRRAKFKTPHCIQWTKDFYPTPGDALACVQCGTRVIVDKVGVKASEVLCQRCKDTESKQ